jgi:hypothetical protein
MSASQFTEFKPGEQVAVMRRGAYAHLYSIDAPCYIVSKTKCGWKVRVETPKGIFFKVIAEANLKRISDHEPLKKKFAAHP